MKGKRDHNIKRELRQMKKEFGCKFMDATLQKLEVKNNKNNK